MASARQAVQRALRAAAARVPDLFAPGARLVVAFSGGQDSTCLLHALANAHLEVEITAAHVDHGLRPNSAESAREVAALARHIGVDFAVRRIDVGRYRTLRKGWSIQPAARAARYRALAEVVDACGARALMVAHTADDQAETLLLNLLRGTGLAGLAGMRLDEGLELDGLGPPLPEAAANIRAVRVARPLLPIARATTLAYCTESGLSIVEDASNQSRVYTRNRVRLDLLPALEQFNPAIKTVLARTADLIAEDATALDAIVAELDAQLGSAIAGAERLEYDLGRWREQPRALQRRLLRRALQRLLGDLVDIPANPIEDALELLRSAQRGQTYHLPYGVELQIIDAGTFSLRRFGQPRARQHGRAPQMRKS